MSDVEQPTDAQPNRMAAMPTALGRQFSSDGLLNQLAAELKQSAIETPFLAMDAQLLNANVQRWRSHLRDVTPFYAVKANVDPLILRCLVDAGANVDVASKFEIDVCRALGVPAENMILSNPRKDLETIRSLAEQRLWATTVDSEEEIDKLVQQGIPSDEYSPVLFLRIKVPTKGVKQDLSSKFGIRVVAPGTEIDRCDSTELRLEELYSVARRAKAAGFEHFGLAFHVGTQCTDAAVYASAIAICQRVGEDLRGQGYCLSWVDIGGGFADGSLAAAAYGTEPSEAHDRLLGAVAEASQRLLAAGYRLIAEPGRMLVADAGTLVTRVTFDRSTHVTGRRIQIDDGVYRTLSARIHDDREFQFRPLRIHNAARAFLPVSSRFAVWGCSCDSFDKVAEDVILPADMQIGDYLTIPTMGAYSTSFGSNTNGFQPATIVLYRIANGQLTWEVSPLMQQNSLILDHIGRWHATRSDR